MTLGYNSRNQLTAAGARGVSATFTYDAEGHRQSASFNGQPVSYSVSTHGALSQTLARQEGNKIIWAVYGHGLLHEVVEEVSGSRLNETAVLYHHHDQAGNTVAVTDQGGKDVLWVQYDAYGAVTEAMSPAQWNGQPAVRPEINAMPDKLSRALAVTPYLFGGEHGVMTDPTGLVHMRARYYHPGLRRFMNPDPIGFAGGMNWYGYAGGSPVMAVDPSGLTVDIFDWPVATKAWLPANAGYIATYSAQYGVMPRDLANALAEEHSALWFKDKVQDNLGSYSSSLLNQVNSATSYWMQGHHRNADIGPANINFDSALSVMRDGEFRYSTANGSDQALTNYLITGIGTADYGARLMAEAQSVIAPYIANVKDANEITALRTNAWREGPLNLADRISANSTGNANYLPKSGNNAADLARRLNYIDGLFPRK